MADDDASSAEMRRLPTHGDADPLALDEDTVERLLTGALPPTQAPAGYAKVAQLLAAAAAAPTPEELAGQEAALAELRAVTRARPAATMAPVPASPPRRRRRTGLAVVVVVGALVTGGAAGAATGHLPGPVRDAARSILGTGGQAPPASTEAGQPPAPVRRPTGSGGGLPGSHPGVSTSRGPGAGPAASPNLEGTCQAFLSGNGAEEGGKLDATAFEALARAAGGQDKIPAYCEALQPKDEKAKQPSDSKEPEEPKPSGNGGQGQGGGPPTSTGGGQGQGNPGQGGGPPTGGPGSEPGRENARREL
jgi:hypothetical protein